MAAHASQAVGDLDGSAGAGAAAPALPRLTIGDGEIPVPGLTGDIPVEAHVWHDLDGRVFATGRAFAGGGCVDVPQLATFWFARGSDEVRAVAHADGRQEAIRRVYERTVLPLVLHAFDTEVLHASAMISRGGVVAFCGESGAGKSTLVRGLEQRGYRVWADDAVALQVSHGGVDVVALPFELRLRAASAEALGHGARAVTLAPERAPDAGARAPLAAVCVLRRVASAHARRAARLGPAAAFVALLRHAYCFSLTAPDRKRRMLGRYAELAARVAVFELPVGGHIEGLAASIDAAEQLAGGES